MTKASLNASLLCLAVSMGVSSGARADAPALIPVQGFLSDAKGAPVKGTHRVTFTIYDAESAGKKQHTDDFEKLDVTNGVFVAYLGTQTPLDLALFQSKKDLWLEVVIDGSEIISPRMQLGSVPYAAYAQSCGEASEAVHAGAADTATGALAQQIVPAGAVMAFDLDACPTGWSELTGARGRTIVGTNPSAAGGVSARTLDESFGAESATLTAAALPPHTHSGTTGSGNPMSYRVVDSGNGAGTATASTHVEGWAGGGYTDYADANYSLAIHTHNFTTDNGPGTSQPISVVQPSLALLYCKKD